MRSKLTRMLWIFGSRLFCGAFQEQFRRSLEKLHVVVLNICASPENVAFRHIPKDNAHFHTDLGQFRGGHQCLLALGFREIEPEEGKAVFTLEVRARTVSWRAEGW